MRRDATRSDPKYQPHNRFCPRNDRNLNSIIRPRIGFRVLVPRSAVVIATRIRIGFSSSRFWMPTTSWDNFCDMGIHIKAGHLDDPRVIQLLTTHITKARAETAPGSAHALDLTGLKSPEIRFWTAWDGELLLGTAALKRLSPSHGEIKSMHIAESARRKGAGSALLKQVIEIARADGMNRLSLETGSWAYFLPARAFYARHGFIECGPFGDYVRDPNSVFMSRDL